MYVCKRLYVYICIIYICTCINTWHAYRQTYKNTHPHAHTFWLDALACAYTCTTHTHTYPNIHTPVQFTCHDSFGMYAITRSYGCHDSSVQTGSAMISSSEMLAVLQLYDAAHAVLQRAMHRNASNGSYLSKYMAQMQV